MKRTHTALLLFCTLLLIGGCSKNTVYSEWKLGSATYRVNGYSNYGNGNGTYVSAPSGYSQGPTVTYLYLPGSLPPKTGDYAITNVGNVGITINVTDSAGRSYNSGVSNRSTSVEVVHGKGVNASYATVSLSIPTIWVYNVANPLDSLPFSATLNTHF
jgi:hypothetical protein